MAIYVEIDIAADVAEVWKLTQTPDLHQRWDLRFSQIEYLPKSEGEPQRFLYATRLGFGLRIEGRGESVAERSTDEVATSALKFWSDDPKSLILEGSGYWQYRQMDGFTRFCTGYDYRIRFGALGQLFDRAVFRPLIGWATAWSFDSMRLWAERGILPEVARREAAIHAMCRLVLAFVWVYQGLVPKLLFPETGELSILRATHMPRLSAGLWVSLIGVVEVLCGLLLVVFWRSKWVLNLQIWALVVLTVGAVASTPRLFIEPFNPATLNVAMVALALVALMAGRALPSAKNCKRRRENP